MSVSMASAELVALHSNLLGRLEIRADTVISFPAGLPGFVALRNFALVETQREDLVWLQSVDDADVTFLLADPFAAVTGFEVEIPTADLATLGSSSGSEESLLVLAVAQLEGGRPTTANLQSPIVIDRERRVGRQVVLPDSRYGMHHPISIA